MSNIIEHAFIPNEDVQEKVEAAKAALSHQLGKPIVGIVVTVLTEEPMDGGTYIMPVNMGMWQRKVQTMSVFCNMVTAFSQYVFTRLLAAKKDL